MPATPRIFLLCAALWLPVAGAHGAQTRTEVRVVPMRPAQPRVAEQWQAGKASTRACIDISNIAGAAMLDPGTVDIVMKGGIRWRLLLDQQCHQLSYYGGIYYHPGKAGQICAGKDRILSRAGGSCRVRAIAPMRQVKDSRHR